MSTCARCGGEMRGTDTAECGGADMLDCCEQAHRQADCRQLELSNLRSLLRSATRRLENARELVSQIPGPDQANNYYTQDQALHELDAVLEILA